MHDLRPRGSGSQRHPEGARADLPQARVGRARRERDLVAHPGGHRRGDAGGRRERGRHRRRGHHQPARDDAGVGPEHRRAGAQRARVAGHPHRQAGGRVLARRRPGPLPGEGRTAARDLLLGSEDPLDPRQRRRGAGQGRGGRPGVRQHGHLAAVEPDRWHGRRPAHHRSHQRQPHDAHGSQDPAVGRRDRRHHGRPHVDAARDQGVERGLRGGQGQRRARRRDDRGRSRRPAGGHLRPDLFRGR